MLKLKNSFRNIFIYLKAFLFKLIIVFGFLSFTLFVLSFSDIPYYAYHYLGVSNTIKIDKPHVIVLLGGNGMPSPDGFIRCYYTAELAKKCTNSKIVIALPNDVNGSMHRLLLMRNELMTKGIDSSRIYFESLGFNTYSQAVNIASMYKKEYPIMIITSPEHMYRAIGTFRKAGFKYVSGSPTFDNPIEEEKIQDKGASKDTRVKSLNLRYNMWSYLNYELVLVREYCAISYYKVKGWM